MYHLRFYSNKTFPALYFIIMSVASIRISDFCHHIFCTRLLRNARMVDRVLVFKYVVTHQNLNYLEGCGSYNLTLKYRSNRFELFFPFLKRGIFMALIRLEVFLALSFLTLNHFSIYSHRKEDASIRLLL